MTITILTGCCLSLLATLPDRSVDTCVTSPPYWGLRNYDQPGQFGLEQTPEQYVAQMVAVFRVVRRVLRDDGTLWLNLGDSYSNVGKWGGRSGGKHASGLHGQTAIGRTKRDYGELKPKDLVGIPWRVAFALQADGWYLRQDIIWSKPNPMPESVRDRCTKSHEYIFLFSKSERYYFDAGAIAEPVAASTITRLSQNVANQEGSSRVPGKTNGTMKAKPPRFGGNKYGDDPSEESRTKSGHEYTETCGRRNRRSVWTVTTKPFKDAHFATFPPDLIEPCILAGSPVGGTVLDPFFGAGTTGLVAQRHGRHCIGIELNPAYVTLAELRLRKDAGMLANVVVNPSKGSVNAE